MVAARLERGCAVAALIFEIELVREFVQHEILAVRRRRGTMTHRVPRQHERAEPAASVAKPIFVALLPDPTAQVALFARRVTRGIDQNRNEVGIVIGLTMQQKQASLTRDGDADFVRQLQPATALEPLFGQKYLGMAEQLRLVRGRQPNKNGEIPLENLSPRVRSGLSAQASAAARFKEVEDHVEE